MPRALDASAYIYEGVWTDWSKPRGLGWTLTLSPNDAAILSPAIAILISVAGSQLWRLTQFAMHQLRATATEQDFFYHQQQVTLRNTSTDLNTLWRLMRIGFAWRHQKQVHSGRRSVGLVLWTVFHVVLVVIFGLFSSYLLNAGDKVLSRSPYCGLFDLNYWDHLASLITPDDKMVQYLTNAQSRYSLASQHSQLCNSTSEACETLPQSKLPWNTTLAHQLCPFNATACSRNVTGSIVFDTGYLSSHTHLGLNAPRNERISYRKVTTCIPMNDSNFVSGWMTLPTADGTADVRVVDAYYGPVFDHARNATYSYSEYSKYMATDQFHDIDPYVLDVKFGPAGTNDTEWQPRPEVSRSDADVIVAFLSSNAAYNTKVNDPWFSAQQLQPNAYNAWNEQVNGSFYVRQNPVTTLGCIEQHQFCLGDGSSPEANLQDCTGLMGQVQLDPTSYPPTINMSPIQLATYNRVLSSAVEASIYSTLYNLNQADLPLLARSLVKDNVGLGLPDNQWQLEASYWQQLSMSMFQHSIIDWSTGQFAAETSYINTTATAEQHQLCQNQIIQSRVYRSFNFLALILISILSTIITIAGLTVEEFMAFWRLKKLRYSASKQDMWILNSDLEMLRLLSEAHTGAAWSRSNNGIPLAEPGRKGKISQFRSKLTRHNTGSKSVRSFFTDEDDATRQSPTQRVSAQPKKNGTEPPSVPPLFLTKRTNTTSDVRHEESQTGANDDVLAFDNPYRVDYSNPYRTDYDNPYRVGYETPYDHSLPGQGAEERFRQ